MAHTTWAKAFVDAKIIDYQIVSSSHTRTLSDYLQKRLIESFGKGNSIRWRKSYSPDLCCWSCLFRGCWLLSTINLRTNRFEQDFLVSCFLWFFFTTFDFCGICLTIFFFSLSPTENALFACSHRLFTWSTRIFCFFLFLLLLPCSLSFVIPYLKLPMKLHEFFCFLFSSFPFWRSRLQLHKHRHTHTHRHLLSNTTRWREKTPNGRNKQNFLFSQLYHD